MIWYKIFCAKAFPSAIALALSLFPHCILAQSANFGPDASSETYRDWMVTCHSTNQEGESSATPHCEMYQELLEQESGQRFLHVSMRSIPAQDIVQLTLITPFGLDVTRPILIRSNELMIAELPFETCVPTGCVAQTQISSEVLDLVGSLETMMIGLPMLNDTVLEIGVSLAGFSAAFARLIAP